MRCLSCNFFNGLICKACEHKIKNIVHLERFGLIRRFQEKQKIRQTMDKLFFYIDEHKKRIKPEWVVSSPAINKAYYLLDLLVKRFKVLK